MTRPRSIIFDLDNTLFDRQAAIDRYLREWLGRHDLELEPELLERAQQVDNLGYAARRVFNQWWAGEVGVRGVTITMDEFWEDFRANLASLIDRDDRLIGWLTELARAHDVAIMTNGSGVNQRAKMTSLGIASILEDARVIVSGEVDSWKPDREIFELGLARLGSDPGDTLFVGDDPINDICGAAAVGIRTCWIARGREFPDNTPRGVRPDHIIEEVFELEQLWR